MFKYKKVLPKVSILIIMMTIYRNLIRILLIVLFTVNILMLYHLTQTKVAINNVQFHRHYLEDNDISCFNSTDDALPLAPEEFPEKSIFFHETSCRGGLDSRQACSIESAARSNPGWQINVLFSGAVSKESYEEEVFKILQRIDNVRIERIHIAEYAKRTPLEKLLSGKILTRSKWRVQHTADILRLLTLYKYGGIYLDLDTLNVNPLDELDKNFVAMQDIYLTGSGVIACTKNGVGRNFTEACLREIRTNFRPDMWSYNGPLLIVRILETICSTTNVTEMSAETCQGFAVYNQRMFYPIHYSNWRDYFQPYYIRHKVYTHHLWNKLSHNTTVPKYSLYANLARQNCPKIYNLYNDQFGM